VRVRIVSNYKTLEALMVSKALWVILHAKPGKEGDVEAFLKSGLALAQAEPGTVTWYALKIGPSTFGIFDSFNDEMGRKAHLAGPIAKALMEKAGNLLAIPPSIEQIDIMAAK
jgi:quinol monooxygenase YgiN